MLETWKKKRLKELAIINYGKSPKEIIAEDGNVPVVGTGGAERFGKDYLYDGESVVLGRKGTIDKPNYINGKCWVIDTAYFLSGFNDANVKWLYYFLTTVDLRSMNEATGVPSLSRNFLYKLEIPTPPIDEQQKIAAILSCVDRVIELTEAMIAKQQRLKAGLMQQLLTKGIDEHGNIRSEATHEFKDSPLGRIPAEWEIYTFEHLIESAVDGPFGSNLKTEHYVAQPGVRVVRLQNIGSGYFDDSDRAYVSEAHALRLERHEVVGGDLIVASLGDPRRPIARACLYPLHLSVGIVKADCFRLRLKSQLALNAYAMYALNCQATRNDIALHGQGVTRDRINLASLKRVRLRTPSIDEQLRIVAVLKSLDKSLAIEL